MLSIPAAAVGGGGGGGGEKKHTNGLFEYAFLGGARAKKARNHHYKNKNYTLCFKKISSPNMKLTASINFLIFKI